VAGLEALDDLGTYFYWANTGQDAGKVRPLAGELAHLCRVAGKRHHQWLQCRGVRAGNESHIGALGRALSAARPDALYVWAFEGQVGTRRACNEAPRAWAEACTVPRDAKGW
jgi:hypothetical protein